MEAPDITEQGHYKIGLLFLPYPGAAITQSGKERQSPLEQCSRPIALITAVLLYRNTNYSAKTRSTPPVVNTLGHAGEKQLITLVTLKCHALFLALYFNKCT